MVTAKYKLGVGRSLLLKKQPYLATAAYALAPVAVENLKDYCGGDMAVTETMVLLYDPEVIANDWSDEDVATGIAHELGHVMRNHIGRGRSYGIHPQSQDASIWNIACFPPGTLLPCGQPIEEVADLQKPIEEQELVNIRHQAGQIVVTSEHPFWVKKRRHKLGLTPVILHDPAWVEAKDIIPGDFVCVPKLERYGLVDDIEIDLSNYVTEGTDSKGRKFGNRAKKRYALTTDTAWLIGLYVAEGSASPTPRFSLGSHEQSIIDRIQQIAAHFDVGFSVSYDGTSAQVNFGGPVLGRWLKEHCGDGAHNKHIPNVILRHTNTEIRHSFLNGLVAGDGHNFSDGRLKRRQISKHCVAVASPGLIQDLILLLAQDGIGGCWDEQILEPRQIGDSFTDYPTHLYKFTWNTNGATYSTRVMNGHNVITRHGKWKADEHGVWYPVKKISKKLYSGPVYNLIDTPDHTYVAGSLLVHNCDACINDDLEAAGFKLLHYDSTTKKLGLQANKTAEHQYEELKKRGTQSKKTGNGTVICCGSGSGHSFEKESNMIPADHPAHRTPSEVERTRRATAEAIVSHAKGRGSVPGGWREWAELTMEPPKVPWQNKLARIGRNKAATKLGDVDYVYSGLSHLQGGLGFGEGVPILPVLRAPELEVIVAFDTSGSMGRKELSDGGTESIEIMKQCGGRVTMIACDCMVHKFEECRSIDDICSLLKAGGGGTSFIPVFEEVEKRRKKPDIIVFVTDGDGIAPAEPPPYDVIWLLVGAHRRQPSFVGGKPWGEIIEVDL